MPRYSAFVALDSGPGEYREIEDLIDAADPRAAAQQVIDAIEATDGSPLVLLIEEGTASIFTADHRGRAVTTDEDIRWQAHEAVTRPSLRVLSSEDAGLVRAD